MASTPASMVSISNRIITPDDVDAGTSFAPGTSSPPPIVSKAHISHSPPPEEPAAASPLVEKRRYLAPSPLDNEKKRRRRLTSDALDNVNINRNVILPLDSLLFFIEHNFCCKRCHKSLTRCADVQVVPPLGLEIFGLACGLNFKCDCGVKESLRPFLIPAAIPKCKTLQNGHPFSTRVNAGDFEINRRLQLGLQLCGGGRQDGNILAGMLNLNVNPMKAKWTQVQEEIGNVIIDIGEEVLEENLHIECLLSPVGQDERRALDVASDTRWDKRGSSRLYNSLSGCSVAFGLRAGLPIGIEAMSSVCIKCTKGITHEPDVCPKNYTGSAKGMEAAGAAKIVCRLFLNDKEKCYVAHLVTDDDSSVRKILTHSYQELIDALQCTIDDWPRYGKDGKGAKKPDNGLLPILHAAINFLADKGHRNRGYSRVIFTEAMKSKKDGCGCTKVDAERMKHRMSWTLRLHSLGTFPEFQRAVLAVLEHHFNNHDHCEAWCKHAGGTEEEIRESGLRFRCKVRNKKLYEFLKKHHEQFMEESKLKQLWHQYDTNLVEAFNKFLTKFLPKDKTYCQTIENKARSMVAVGIQSIGYRQFYARVFERTGIEVKEDDITGLFLRKEDADKLWRKHRRRKEDVKIARMRDHYRKVKEGVAKLKADNAKALSYAAGMMGPDAGDESELPQLQRQQQQKGKTPKGSVTCRHCGIRGHQRTSSFQCLKNPKNLTNAADEKTAQEGGK